VDFVTSRTSSNHQLQLLRWRWRQRHVRMRAHLLGCGCHLPGSNYQPVPSATPHYASPTCKISDRQTDVPFVGELMDRNRCPMSRPGLLINHCKSITCRLALAWQHRIESLIRIAICTGVAGQHQHSTTFDSLYYDKHGLRGRNSRPWPITFNNETSVRLITVRDVPK